MTGTPEKKNEQVERVPLSKAAQYLLEECRMVLPGIQALFGFQLMAVFNSGFDEKLTATEQRFHLVAIGLLAIAIALIMAPAAYHRQTCPREVTQSFIRLATRLLLASMAPLAISICIDFYLVAHVIASGILVGILTALLFGFFVWLWFVFPRIRSFHRAS
jgi:hypothetical protein